MSSDMPGYQQQMGKYFYPGAARQDSALLARWNKLKAALGDMAPGVGFPEETLAGMAQGAERPFGGEQPAGTFAGQTASLKQGAQNMRAWLIGQGLAPEEVPNDYNSLLDIMDQVVKQGQVSPGARESGQFGPYARDSRFGLGAAENSRARQPRR